MRFLIHKLPKVFMSLVGFCAIIAYPNIILASMIDPNVVITGTVQLDSSTTIPVGNASQSAVYSATSGGSSLASLNCLVNCVVGSANAGGYSGTSLTHLGDGVGIETAVSGSGSFAFNEFFLNDYSIDLMNNSLTDTFLITFQIDFSQDASITAVAAAKATLDVDRELPLPAVNELFSFGNLDTTLGMPGPFSDAGIITFDMILAPLEIGMLEGRQDIEGFTIGASYSINQQMFISVLDVRNLTVPIPAAAWLFGTGLIALIGAAKRRKPA